jgi:hypothetical protein
MDIPEAWSVLPLADPKAATGLRNHIIACRWVTEVARQHMDHDSAGLAETDVPSLSAIVNKGTNSEMFYRGWGRGVKLGACRSMPIAVRSNPLRVFLYPEEVPACMQRFFFQWRDKARDDSKKLKSLHVLILACQALAYLVHIHYFPRR